MGLLKVWELNLVILYMNDTLLKYVFLADGTNLYCSSKRLAFEYSEREMKALF